MTEYVWACVAVVFVAAIWDMARRWTGKVAVHELSNGLKVQAEETAAAKAEAAEAKAEAARAHERIAELDGLVRAVKSRQEGALPIKRKWGQ